MCQYNQQGKIVFSRIVSMVLLALLSLPAWAADLANGQMLSKSCALCHGIYGQGASGKLSPRIAGLPKEYIVKAIRDYVDKKRIYPLMVRTAELDRMSEKDIDDVASYLASLDLSSDRRFDIVPRLGVSAEGKDIYKSDCKNCHARRLRQTA